MLDFFRFLGGLIWGASGEEGVRREGGLAIKIARQNVKRGVEGGREKDREGT